MWWCQLISPVSSSLPSWPHLFHLFGFLVCWSCLSTSDGYVFPAGNGLESGPMDVEDNNAGTPSPGLMVVAAEGGKAVMPCPVTRPFNDSIDLILWFRGEAETALYSLDARSGPIQRAKHFPSDDLSTRAYIDITGRPTSLVFESIRKDDAGLYKCRVDFRRGRTQYRSINLNVVIPPKHVIIMNENGELLSSSNLIRSQNFDSVGPYNERAHLTLVCEAEGGNPIPVLRWLKDGVAIDDSWMLTPQGIVRNELVITRLKRSDLMSTLTCEAVNSNLTEPASTSITLDLNLRPLDVRISSMKRPLSAGKRVQLTCESTGSRPPAIVTWWLGSRQLTHVNEEISPQQNMTTSTLYYTPSSEDHGKVVSCRSDHSILPDSALEDSWVLDIYHVPRLQILHMGTSHKNEVREGMNVTLQCVVDSNPKVSQVSWSFDGKSVTPERGSFYEFDNFTLSILAVSREDAGKYRCSSINVEGEGESEDVMLKVFYAPVCRPDQKKIFGVATREPIQVPCEVEADPPQVSFHWSLNNTHDMMPIRNFVSSNLRSVAIYAPRTKFGYGTLLCWAINTIGTQKEPCVYNVIAAGPPSPVQNCLVGNQSIESLIVKCEPGDDGGLEQEFFLEIYHSGRGQLQANLTSIKAPVFDVQNLPMSTSFVLVLFAANGKGRSHSVALAASTLPFLNKEVTTITPSVAILIGIVGTLMLTAASVTLISRLKDRPTSKDDGTKGRMNPLGESTKNLDESSHSSGNVSQQDDDLDIHGASYMNIRTNNTEYVKNEAEGASVLVGPGRHQDDVYYYDGNKYCFPSSNNESNDNEDKMHSTYSGYENSYIFPATVIMRDSAVVLSTDEVLNSDGCPPIGGVLISDCSNKKEYSKSTPISTPV